MWSSFLSLQKASCGQAFYRYRKLFVVKLFIATESFSWSSLLLLQPSTVKSRCTFQLPMPKQTNGRLISEQFRSTRFTSHNCYTMGMLTFTLQSSHLPAHVPVHTCASIGTARYSAVLAHLYLVMFLSITSSRHVPATPCTSESKSKRRCRLQRRTRRAVRRSFPPTSRPASRRQRRRTRRRPRRPCHASTLVAAAMGPMAKTTARRMPEWIDEAAIWIGNVHTDDLCTDHR